jgi:Icc-related predicted phosphoesterase
MKILAVSDRVVDQLYSSRVSKNYPDIDLLISCGDLPFYYLEFLVSALDAPMVYVLGNHDQSPQYTADGRTLSEVHGGQDIHARVLKEKNLLLAGLEGSMRYRPNAPLMYTESEMRQEVGRLLLQQWWCRMRHGRFVDILVTHSPPFQIHDRPDQAHVGFKIFHNLMKWFRPRFLLHGHIHVYRQDATRVTQFEDTTVVKVQQAIPAN